MFHLKKIEILRLHPMLVQLAEEIKEEFGLDVVTSAWRDDGVHGDGRGLDLRCRDAVIGKRIAKVKNRQWTYDPTRPRKRCVLFHDIGLGPHLHLQVHPNTIKEA